MDAIKKLSLGARIRLVLMLLILILFYVDWAHPSFRFSSIGFGLILAGWLAVFSLQAARFSKKNKQATRFVWLPIIGNLVFFLLVAWYWLYNDLLKGSAALPFHLFGLLLLVMLHFVRPGGYFDPDRKVIGI